eukprot:CAMPEP_0177648908 /NCGR_PEP_ID=MMETSP0447-20121125/11083_2 /TAXON_ID=0 /ORGANISM="Stygamoeba regulata, Strain BSH-02190019" /LENGTH=133 /DNA_ID=CAMNT_0019151589 /DNA_START=141 /DNA_END=542 /DNA_ORIENTATION=-
MRGKKRKGEGMGQSSEEVRLHYLVGGEEGGGGGSHLPHLLWNQAELQGRVFQQLYGEVVECGQVGAPNHQRAQVGAVGQEALEACAVEQPLARHLHEHLKVFKAGACQSKVRQVVVPRKPTLQLGQLRWEGGH